MKQNTNQQAAQSACSLTQKPCRFTMHVLLIAIAMLICYSLFASCSSLWDRDEPRFARAAVEMWRACKYLVPTFNTDLRPDKPILIYWLMTACLKIIGFSSLAVRLPSIISVTGAAMVTSLIGKRMFSPRVGVQAMIILATTLLPIYMGTAATADGTLLFWTTLSIFCFIDRLYTGKRFWQLPLLAIAMGFAQLTKGPVGLAVPGLTILTTAWLGRKEFKLGRNFWVGFAIALGVSIGMFLAWGIPANDATGGELARQGLGRHVFHRMTHAMEGHGGSNILGYLAAMPLYVPLLIAGFFPWTLHLPAAISATLGKRLGTPKDRAVILGWALPTFIMMSFVATKLPHYIMPIFPILAICCAQVITLHQQNKLDNRDRKWLREGFWFFGPIIILAALGLLIVPWLTHDMPLIIRSGIVAIFLIIIATSAIRFQYREQVKKSTYVTALGTAFFFISVGFIVLPRVENLLKIAPRLAAAVHQKVPPDTAIYHWGYNEPSVVFYLNLPPDQAVMSLGRETKNVPNWLANQHQPLVIITRQSFLDKYFAGVSPAGMTELFRQSIMNYSSHGRQQDVVALYKK